MYHDTRTQHRFPPKVTYNIDVQCYVDGTDVVASLVDNVHRTPPSPIDRLPFRLSSGVFLSIALLSIFYLHIIQNLLLSSLSFLQLTGYSHTALFISTHALNVHTHCYKRQFICISGYNRRYTTRIYIGKLWVRFLRKVKLSSYFLVAIWKSYHVKTFDEGFKTQVSLCPCCRFEGRTS